MPSIDNRVVEMQFNNAQFERGIKTSTDSLGRLKESLNFDKQSASLKQFERYSNSLDFSTLQNGIETIKNRFSTLGIVGAEVVRTLTSEAIYLGKRIVSNVAAPLSNVTQLMKEGGKQRALNVEQAKFIMEGLKLDFESFNDDINNAVSGTRFGYDEAAMAASQLAASGISAKKKLDKSGKEISYMGEALLAISGAAAMTNSEYSEMAHLFTTVASNGKLMTEQVRSFSTRGLNITADLAKYFGTSEKAMADMISKGKIDFAKFSEAVYELYGDQATKADEMLTGVTANIRAAWKKIGQDFWGPIVANNGPIVKGLQKFKDLVNNTIRPSVRSLFELDGKAFLEDNTWMRLITNIGEAMQKVFGSDYTLKLVERSIKSIGGAVKTVVDGVNAFVTSEHTANAIKNTIDAIGQSFEALSSFIKPFADIFNDVFGDLIPKVTLEKVDELSEKFNKFSLYLRAVMGVKLNNSDIHELAGIINPTSTSFSQLQRLWGSLIDIFKSVSTVARSAFDAFQQFFKSTNINTNGFVGIIEQFANFAKSISEFVTTTGIFEKVAEAFSSFIAPAIDFIVYHINYLFEAFNSFIKSEGLWTSIIDIFKSIAEIAGAAFAIAKDAIGSFFKVLNIDGDAIAGIVEHFANFVRGISEFIRKVGAVTSTTHIFEKVFTTISNFLAPAIDFIVEHINGLLDALGKLASWGGNKVADFLIMFNHAFFTTPKEASSESSPFGKFSEWALGKLESIKKAAKSLGDKFAPMMERVKMRIIEAIGRIKEAFSSDAVGTSLKAGGLIAGGMIFQQLFSKFIPKIVGKIAKLVSPIVKLKDKIAGVLSSITGFLSAQTKAINVERIKTLAEAILIIAGALFVLSLIPADQLKTAVGGITAALIEVGAMLKFLDKLSSGSDDDNLSEVKFAAKATGFAIEMIGIASALLILSFALKMLSKLDPEGLGRAVLAIGGLLLGLGLFIKYAQIDKNAKIPAVSLILLAISVRILAGALAKIAELDDEAIGRGIIGLGFIMTALGLFTRYAKNPEGFTKTTFALILLSVAIQMLSKVVKNLGEMDPEALARGLFGLSGILAAIWLFVKYIKIPEKGLTKTVFALVTLSVVIKILASAVKNLGEMDPEALARGLLGVGGLIAGLIVLTKYLGTKDGLTKAAFSMLILSAAMTVLANVVNSLGNMDPEKLALGLFGLGVALLEIGIAMHYMSKDSMNAGTMAGMLMMSVMINALAAALVKMSAVDPEGMALALIGLGVGLAALVIAMNALGGADTSGLDILAKGAAFVMMGIGLNMLADSLVKMSNIEPEKMAVALFGLSVALIAMAAASLIASKPLLALGSAVALFGAGVGALAWGLAKISVALIPIVTIIVAAGPEIIEFLKNLVIGFAEVLPTLVRGLVNAVGAFFDALVDNADEIADSIGQLILTVLRKLKEIIPEIIAIIGETLSEIWTYLEPALATLFPWLLEKLSAGWEWLKENFLPILGGFLDWAWGLIMGFFGWILQGVINFVSSVNSFFSGLVGAIVSTLQDWWDAGVEFVTNLIGGIGEKVGEGIENVKQFAQDMVDGINGFFQDFYEAGANLVQGVIDGIGSLWDTAIEKFKGLGSSMWQKFTQFWDEHSPSRRSKWGAEMIVRGLVGGIDDFGHLATDAMSGLNDDMWDTMDWVNGSIIDALNNEADPTITPVLDLSNIQNGANAIDSMFGARTMSLAASADAQMRANRMAKLDAIEANTTNADVVAALGLLRGDVNNLNDSFSNTQVVLDSGALVGATAKKMDNALGRFRVLKGRGI